MISVEEARALVKAEVRAYGEETIPLHQGIGRVLRENWTADRDLPPYDRVTMDGIAISFDGGISQSTIEIEGLAKAGDPRQTLLDPRKCLEAMTGAVLPERTDTIIRYEDLEISGKEVKILTEVVKGQNVHTQGLDRKKGDLIVKEGTLLSAADIGVGASTGCHEISVATLPKVIVISTGDELVEINETPASHQIRRGNVYRIQAQLQKMGITCDADHLVDELDTIIHKLEGYLSSYDAVILSGGVSKGKLDYIPDALKACGVKKIFHKITQRPGKPMWFGQKEGGAVVFGLPGNPVSSFMCFSIYVAMWLNETLGITMKAERAVLSDDVEFKPDLTYFLEVSLSQDASGMLLAHPRKGNGSGDLANLVEAEALIELTKGRDLYKAGEVYPIFRYR